MNKLTETAVKAYFNIDFKDMLKVLPTMDTLVEFINKARLYKLYMSLDRDERDEYEYVYMPTEYKSLEEAEASYNTLHEIGFEASIDLITPSKDMLKLKNTPKINLRKKTSDNTYRC